MEEKSIETYYDIELSDEKIRVKRKQKLNFFLIAIMLILMVFFGFLGFQFAGYGITNVLFFVGLELIIIAILWVNHKDMLYPELEVDLKHMSATERPSLSFMQPKVTWLKKITGVDFLVKPISGHASPFEEGNTDYRKRLVLTTSNKDITLVSYINRNENLEESAQALVDKLQSVIGGSTIQGTTSLV